MSGMSAHTKLVKIFAFCHGAGQIFDNDPKENMPSDT